MAVTFICGISYVALVSPTDAVLDTAVIAISYALLVLPTDVVDDIPLSDFTTSLDVLIGLCDNALKPSGIS